ncbi:hypothetical protein PsYK624_028750 [Phanerochaete sordida]|uniref:Uncharacterized protein n=1 Tax=Phanerochaete sordida TaxID=48140 RepID=A0A9P3G294_9APHY|nr:hypothetical protein PsYK624_028750 [Phanerochaete sordida]
MGFFTSTKLTARKAAAPQKPSVTVCTYDLDAGVEARHTPVPPAEAQRPPLVRYRALTAAEEIDVTRTSPLEELTAWAIAEAASASASSASSETGAGHQARADVRPLVGAFVEELDDDEFEVLYTPLGAGVRMESPGHVDLSRWYAASNSLAQPSLLSARSAAITPEMEWSWRV